MLLWLAFHYFLLFLFYSSYLLTSVAFLPFLPALFPFLFEFWTCWGQGLTFCRSQQRSCSVSEESSPRTYGVRHTLLSSFPVYTRTQGCFSGTMFSTFFHCMFQAWLPSFQVYFCEFLFSHYIKSQVLFVYFCSLCIGIEAISTFPPQPLSTYFFPENYRVPPLLLLFSQCHTWCLLEHRMLWSFSAFFKLLSSPFHLVIPMVPSTRTPFPF